MDYDEASYNDTNDGDTMDEEELLPDGCPSSGNPGNLLDLADQADSMANNCASLYSIDILYNQLAKALALFKVNSQDYDDKFGWYAQWTKDHIQGRLDAFVSIYNGGTGLKYMTCYYTISGKPEVKDTCMGMPHFWDDDLTWTICFQLDDEDSFYNALVAESGIDKSWVIWGDHDDPFTCQTNGDTRPGGGSGNLPCRKVFHHRKNIPLKADNNKIEVGNPEAVIEASMSNILALQNSMLSSYLDICLTFYDGNINLPPLQQDPRSFS